MYLISIQLATRNFSFTLLLEGEDYQSHKDVEEEKREYHNKCDVIKRVSRAVIMDWTFVYFCSVHSGLHGTGSRKSNRDKSAYWVSRFVLIGSSLLPGLAHSCRRLKPYLLQQVKQVFID